MKAKTKLHAVLFIGNAEFRIVISLCIALLFFASACGISEHDQTSRKNIPMEKKLADLNAGHTVDDNDITVARFRSLLDQLSQRFPEARDKIGDMTFKTQELLKKDGISESLLRIMEGLNQASKSSQSKGRKYAEYATAYTMLRNQGLSHEETIDGLEKAMMLVPIM
jgi:hypothetical protein